MTSLAKLATSLTSCFPRSSAAALKDGRFPGLLPQKTQTARSGLRPPPLLSATFSGFDSISHEREKERERERDAQKG